MPLEDFREALKPFYSDKKRDMPWRLPEPNGHFDPYKILVSEIMLQQTQVSRVVSKYQEFVTRFPDIQNLAGASLGEVLRVWSGLGYNRRAKFLWQAAEVVVREYGGKLPTDTQALIKLPGVGKNTAGALLVYAYNKPEVFIETNIRTVYIHHFFNEQQGVSDSHILGYVAKTIDKQNPRGFYWALMDYGSYLKQQMGSNNYQSKHYKKQSTFSGSTRKVRGEVIRLLTNTPMTIEELDNAIDDERISAVVTALVREGMVNKSKDVYSL